VAKIKLVKPDKVAAIENSLITAAQQGKIRNKISEQELVSMLESQTKN
jgi:DNA-binding TFAR19-related protein (PDSD5 family)